MGFGAPALADEQLKRTQALPNGAAAVSSASLDLGNGPRGDFITHCEAKLSAPAVTVGMLADAGTITYKLEDSADDSSWATVQDALLVQTGAGGAGAVAAEKRFRFPTTIRRYVRVTATKSVSGNASTVSLTFQLLF